MKKLSPNTITRFKNTILGRDFDLSVAFVMRKKMQKLNANFRGIDAPTDILSFPYSKKSGEIVLCMSEVISHAKLHHTLPDEYLRFLFIHGMLHLKGLDHGRIMDRQEKKFWNILHGNAHRSRHRRRNLPSTGSRLAI